MSGLVKMQRSSLQRAREFQQGCESLYNGGSVYVDEKIVELCSEMMDGWMHLQHKIEQKAASEMKHGYQTFHNIKAVQQSPLLQLDSNLILEILQFSSSFPIDALAFSMVSRAAHSMLLHNLLRHCKLVGNRMENLCDRFSITKKALFQLLVEYEGILSGGASVFCLSDITSAATADECPCCDLDIYLSFTQGMKLLSHVSKVANSFAHSIPILSNYRYICRSGTVFGAPGEYDEGLFAVNVHMVVVFCLQPPPIDIVETEAQPSALPSTQPLARPSADAKKIEFIILKPSSQNFPQELLTRTQSYFDFTVCANSISVQKIQKLVNDEVVSETYALSIVLRNSGDIIDKKLVVSTRYRNAHRVLREFCRCPQSAIRWDAYERRLMRLQDRFHKYVDRGFTPNDEDITFVQYPWHLDDNHTHETYWQVLHNGRTELHYRVENFGADEDLKKIEDYIKHSPQHVMQAEHEYLYTPAHTAAAAGNIAVLDLLVDNFPSVALARTKDCKFPDDCLPDLMELLHRRSIFHTRTFDDTLKFVEAFEAVRDKLMAIRKDARISLLGARTQSRDRLPNDELIACFFP